MLFAAATLTGRVGAQSSSAARARDQVFPHRQLGFDDLCGADRFVDCGVEVGNGSRVRQGEIDEERHELPAQLLELGQRATRKCTDRTQDLGVVHRRCFLVVGTLAPRVEEEHRAGRALECLLTGSDQADACAHRRVADHRTVMVAASA